MASCLSSLAYWSDRKWKPLHRRELMPLKSLWAHCGADRNFKRPVRSKSAPPPSLRIMYIMLNNGVISPDVMSRLEELGTHPANYGCSAIQRCSNTFFEIGR